MPEVKLQKSEPVGKALRRLKKRLDREKTPSARKRRKMKAARFPAMLKARYADE